MLIADWYQSFFVQNFVRNSINVRDPNTLAELWDAFSGAAEELKGDKTPPTTEIKEIETNGVGNKVDLLDSLPEIEDVPPVKKSKKKKKKKELISEDLSSKDTGSEDILTESKKKKKKSKHTREISSEEVFPEDVKTKPQKKKEHKQGRETHLRERSKDDTQEPVVTVESLSKKKIMHKYKESPSKETSDNPTDFQFKKKRKRSHLTEENFREPTKKVKVATEAQ